MGFYTNLLLNTAVLKTVNGTDENGRPIIIALEEIDCKIEFKNTIVKNSFGEETSSSGRLFTESIVKTDDIIEVTDKEYKVISVKPYYPIDSSLFVINEVHFA